jgi:hypothetical protein
MSEEDARRRQREETILLQQQQQEQQQQRPANAAAASNVEIFQAIEKAVEKEIENFLTRQQANTLPSNTFEILCGKNNPLSLGAELYDWYIKNKNLAHNAEQQKSTLESLVISPRVKQHPEKSERLSLLMVTNEIAQTLMPVIVNTVESLERTLKQFATDKRNAYLLKATSSISSGGGIQALKESNVIVLASPSALEEFDGRFIKSQGRLCDSANLVVRTHNLVPDNRSVDHLFMSNYLAPSVSRSVHVLSSGLGTGKSTTAMLMAKGGVAMYLLAREIKNMLDQIEKLADDALKERDAKTEEAVISGLAELVYQYTFKQDNYYTRVCIVIDEVGPFPNFIRGLCHVWKGGLQSAIANQLNICSDNLFLITVGTGLENLQITKVGSVPHPSTTYIMRPATHDAVVPVVFKHLLTTLIAGNNLIAITAQQFLFETSNSKNNEIWKPIITDDFSLRFHELIRNARCAAIACRLMFMHFINHRESFEQNSKEGRLQFVRSLLSNIVEKFAAKNGK